jgi:hypothetical protein
MMTLAAKRIGQCQCRTSRTTCSRQVVMHHQQDLHI